MTIALAAGVVWTAVGAIVAWAGGFDVIRDVEINQRKKTAHYRLTLLAVYPIILLRAAIRAFFSGPGV